MSGKWTLDQEHKLREIFNIWDEDGSNFLTKAEMRPMVKKMMSQGYKFKSNSNSSSSIVNNS